MSVENNSTPYVTTVGAPQPLPIHSVFQEGEFVPIRAKIQTNELSYNGTILLNREDLLRAISVLNFQYGGVQERNALCVCWLTCFVILFFAKRKRGGMTIGLGV